MATVEISVPKTKTRSVKQPKESVPKSGANLRISQPFNSILFKFLAIYLVLQIVPWQPWYYAQLFTSEWPLFSLGWLFDASRFAPRFFGETQVFTDWLIVAGIALVASIVWHRLDRSTDNLDRDYYRLRALVRYRLAAALLVFGFIKFFPLQMPYPSLSNLNTNYGDLTEWKLFSMTLGIVPGYQSFLGLVEIASALLLLNRKTATFATFIIIPYLGNVALSNLAYGGDEGAYAFLLVSFALFLLAFDVQRLITATSLEQPATPNTYRPVFESWQKTSRYAAKGLFILVFVVLFGIQARDAYQKGGVLYPKKTGVAKWAGKYLVKTFEINGQELPVSTNDDVRWQDVVIEPWATLSIRKEQVKEPVTAGITVLPFSDGEKIYEFSGNASRDFYTYELDHITGQWTFANRNPSHAGDRLYLSIEEDEDGLLKLKGTHANGDSLSIILEKIDKKYLLQEAAKTGRRRALKL